MSISVSNDLHTQSYIPAIKKNNSETSSFTIPDMNDTTVTDVSESHASSKIGIDDNGMIQNHLRSQVQMLPAGWMTDEELMKYQEERTAKIVYDFHEDGTVTIKEGLSKADYLRAIEGLEVYYRWLRGK